MNLIMRVLGQLEDSGYISRIPTGDDYTSPEYDASGHMIGACNNCSCETTSTCPSCRFFLCSGCECDVCASEG